MNNKAIGSSWNEVRKEIFTPEEIAESNLRVALVGKLIKARKERGITSPNIETVLKVLAPLGKTLYIGDIKV